MDDAQVADGCHSAVMDSSSGSEIVSHNEVEYS